ncbi:MAG: hypothetical protein L0I76_36980 [Pseudonocardia sp.]|uniref:Uncharacterized protein n=1 Tax=Pseudonocardia parietis TaxID=570936 RepID=A0ABS4W5T1_9PSEU|nr:hypothetical protein [Pseudonocardia parietis]MBP2371566.1 hypothetical protein [Pseudonocardia parietis]MDN5920637.1 hypothetical protein [Pseudonocardia sp.]
MTDDRTRPQTAHLALVTATEDRADATGRPGPATGSRPSTPGTSAEVTLSAAEAAIGLGITEDEVLIRQRRGELPDPIPAGGLAEHGGPDLRVRT